MDELFDDDELDLDLWTDESVGGSDSFDIDALAFLLAGGCTRSASDISLAITDPRPQRWTSKPFVPSTTSSCTSITRTRTTDGSIEPITADIRRTDGTSATT